MARLTDTQLIILSAASQRDDRAVELPATVKDEAARKAVDKLIRAGLLEEVRAGSSLPVWRRDDSGAMALRITKTGLEAIDVEDEATDSYPAEARELVFSGDLIVFVVTIRTFVVAGSGHFALVGSTVIGPRGNSL